jgi:hypothetical protein
VLQGACCGGHCWAGKQEVNDKIKEDRRKERKNTLNIDLVGDELFASLVWDEEGFDQVLFFVLDMGREGRREGE